METPGAGKFRRFLRYLDGGRDMRRCKQTQPQSIERNICRLFLLVQRFCFSTVVALGLVLMSYCLVHCVAEVKCRRTNALSHAIIAVYLIYFLMATFYRCVRGVSVLVCL